MDCCVALRCCRVGFIQKRLFGCLDCLWFDRAEARDREQVATKYEANASDWASVVI
jgi:hypothetical protein